MGLSVGTGQGKPRLNKAAASRRSPKLRARGYFSGGGFGDGGAVRAGGRGAVIDASSRVANNSPPLPS